MSGWWHWFGMVGWPMVALVGAGWPEVPGVHSGAGHDCKFGGKYFLVHSGDEQMLTDMARFQALGLFTPQISQATHAPTGQANGAVTTITARPTFICVDAHFISSSR